MTREEAIGELKLFKGHTFTKTEEALDMAIEALKQEPKTDAVSRQAISDNIFEKGIYNYFEQEYMSQDLDDAINETPPVTPTRPKGHWINSNIPNEEYVCSECGGANWYYDYQANVTRSKYCPNCGADMKGEE